MPFLIHHIFYPSSFSLLSLFLLYADLDDNVAFLIILLKFLSSHHIFFSTYILFFYILQILLLPFVTPYLYENFTTDSLYLNFCVILLLIGEYLRYVYLWLFKQYHFWYSLSLFYFQSTCDISIFNLYFSF